MSRAVTIVLIPFLAVASISARATEPCPDGLDLDRILGAHGAPALGEVRALDFTFNVDRAGAPVTRRWHWDLDTHEVTLSTTTEQGTPLLLAFPSPPPADASEDIARADRWFINDRYWFLFPLPLATDEGVLVTLDCAAHTLPISGDTAPQLTAAYGDTGGYTPGDAYDFFATPEGRVDEWIFRRGGAPEPTLVVSFDDYARVGPLTLSLTRNRPDGAPLVWFTDVQAILEDGPHPAVPLSEP